MHVLQTLFEERTRERVAGHKRLATRPLINLLSEECEWDRREATILSRFLLRVSPSGSVVVACDPTRR